jgi:hypothetical protein
MDHKTYRARISDLHSEMCALNSKIHATMGELGGNPETAEWNLLYNVASSVSVALRIMYDTVLRSPYRSALTEQADAGADVAMVCSTCRGPVVSLPADAPGRWRHADHADDFDCAQLGPIMAMVAAGNENVPAE